MGEGWSDWFGKMIVLRENDTRDMIFPMGGYVTTDGSGIRTFPYTSNMDENPLTLNFMAETPYSTSVHAAGTIWCTALWEVMWNLIEKHGWDENNFADGTGGNNIMTQLVIDGMKLQPCRPSMLDARDAIIMADELAYGGDNFCEIWIGFAKRGMGIGASGNSGGDFNLPTECGGEPTMPPTTPPPTVRPPMCDNNNCVYAYDVDCDDGGEGADYSLCSYGTDCFDCCTKVPSRDECV